MKKKPFLNDNDKTKSSNKTLTLLVFLIGGLVLHNTMTLESLPGKERTIIIPAGLDRKVWFTGDKASDEYMKAQSREIASLALNYTPVTVKNNFTELLTYYPPQRFDEAKANFYKLADDVIRDGFSSVFFIKDYSLNDAKNTMEITGERLIMKTGADTTSSMLTYVIHYKMNNGRFEIEELYEKKPEQTQVQNNQPKK